MIFKLEVLDEGFDGWLWIADTFVNSMSGIANDLSGGDWTALSNPHVGLFLHCKVPEGKKFFEGECIPNMESIQTLFTDLDDRKYPHTWRGAVLVFIIGLALMVREQWILCENLCRI